MILLLELALGLLALVGSVTSVANLFGWAQTERSRWLLRGLGIGAAAAMVLVAFVASRL